MIWIIFGILSFLCVGSVAAMIFSRNPAHNALLLVLCFASLGGVFGLLDAPFAAVVQIIVYAGAIMVLFLFAVMTLNLKEGQVREKRKRIPAVAAVLAVVLLAELLVVARKAFFRAAESVPAGAAAEPMGVGQLLFTRYLYPFEITSILLIAALIGAMVMAGTKEPR